VKIDAPRPENMVQRSAGHEPTTGRKVLFWTVVAVLLLLLAEAGAWVVLRVAYGRSLTEAERLHDYDSELGWVNMKDRRALNRYGTGGHATHNSLGLRATKEYTAAVPAGRYRIIFLGDSFTYGVDTGDAGTFVAQLESLAPSIETVNMGVAGYGIDQMYLWYMREQSRFAADLLVLALIDDDLRRMKLSVFLTQNPKPRLFLRGDAVTVTNVPVPTWGAVGRSGWLEDFPNGLALVRILRSIYEMFLQSYDPWALAEHIFADLNRLSGQKHQRFVLVYLPTKADLASDRRSEVAGHLEEFTARERIRFLDLTDRLKAARKPSDAPLFAARATHYSEAGYKLIAESLLEGLRRELPEVPR